jgi:hypothetical protein
VQRRDIAPQPRVLLQQRFLDRGIRGNRCRMRERNVQPRAVAERQQR